MKAKGERGSVLAQVLMLAVVASLMCATILRARFQPALATARVVDRVSDDLAAQGAINRINEVWVRTGPCSSDGVLGVSCSATVGGGPCGCSCLALPFATGGPVVSVVSTGSGAACTLAAARQ
jgi:hypothetical protein